MNPAPELNVLPLRGIGNSRWGKGGKLESSDYE